MKYIYFLVVFCNTQSPDSTSHHKVCYDNIIHETVINTINFYDTVQDSKTYTWTLDSALIDGLEEKKL